jgi:DNA-binding transcriptional LysR family regulator
MAQRTNLDMDVLRTFVTGFELGSFARAADRLGRSQSAISTQLRKLEEQVGQPLVQKAGRGLALTGAGENLLGYAKRILELNDEAVQTMRGSEVEGWVRFGLPQDFAESWLPAVLGQFARAHPKVRVEIHAERNAFLLDKVAKDELDLALAWGNGADNAYAEQVAALPVGWIGKPGWPGAEGIGSEPLPLIAFDSPCVFRTLGLDALREAGIAWRVVVTSPSLAGLWAAAEAGFGVTVRTAFGVPRTLSMLDPQASGLPALPPISLALHRAQKAPTIVVSRLADILRETIRDRVAMLREVEFVGSGAGHRAAGFQAARND